MIGDLRGAVALARVTMFELLRRGTLPLAFLGLTLYVGFLRLPVELDPTAARARFLDQAFSAGAAGLVLVAAVAGLQLAAGRARGGSGEDLARQAIGESAQHWGRALGLSAVLVLLGLGLGLTIMINVGLRFDDLVGVEAPIRHALSSEGFRNERETRFARPGASAEALVFDLGHGDPDQALEFRFSPRLLLVGRSAALRAGVPIALEIRALDGGYRRRRVLELHEGKPLRVALDLPRAQRGRLAITVENPGSGWLIGFTRGDATILAGADSLAAAILRAGLILGLYAAFFAMIAYFLRGRVGAVSALLLTLAFALLSSSFAQVEDGLFDRLPGAGREVAATLLGLLLPDFARHDVAAMLVRGVSPAWAQVGDAGLRLAIGSVLVGFLARVRKS
ncbi:MAG: hypothetical protein H6807_14645 [Planctomycetes bacterium]|nr:hypothetical protein [Planctomycetota bacterium]